MQSSTILALEEQYETGLYSKRPIAIVRGTGAYVWDAEGRRYIDCIGGQGSANVGHCHPAVVAAIQEQTAVLMSCSEILPNDQRAAYLVELAAVLPFPARMYPCNSGAEAVEASIKFARLLTGRQRIVAAMRGFHGRTMGALSATWEAKYRKPFEPLVPEFVHVPYDNLDALAAAVDAHTAAVLIEPVQGEGGVRVPGANYLAGVRQLCDAHGALMLLDEIQTGFGRTGRLFALEHTPAIPDMLCLAKSIAGGLPMGLVAMHARHGTLPPGSHGSTFGGNPLICATARAVLQVIQKEDLPRQAAEKGAWLREQLCQIASPRIREVRGMGLLIGIELKERVQPYLVGLLERGVLTLPAGPNVLRLLPPLVIGYDELETVVSQIRSVLM